MLFKYFSNKRSEPIMNHLQNKIIIYQSELDYLSKCIIESPNIETGGNLFGLWTPFGVPFIHYVVGPGPNAIHNTTHFRQDYNFLKYNADLLVEEHALHHIGSWHSHHSLGLAQPSHGDTESTLSGMRECRLSSFILLIGNYRHGKSTVNAFRYFNDGTCVKLKWVILKGESPFRAVYDKTHSKCVYQPSANANMDSIEQCRLSDNNVINHQAPEFEKNYWLSNKENNKEFVRMVKYLQEKYEKVGIYQMDNATLEFRIEDSGFNFKIVLDSTFPQKAPKCLVPKDLKFMFKTSPLWDMADDGISTAFINYINSIELCKKDTLMD